MWKLGLFSGIILAILISVIVVYSLRVGDSVTYEKMEKVAKGEGPVDVVFTWVDLSDEDWWGRYDAAYGRTSYAHVKREVNDEIFFATKGVIKHLPWVDKIYILTQRPQRPHWVDEPGFEKVQVVHHDECGLKEDTYNGMQATSLVPFVPGLSDLYLQIDDDIVITQDLPREYFFDGNVPIYRLHEIPFPTELSARMPLTYNYCGIRNSTHQLMKETFRKGKWKRYDINHFASPMVKSMVMRARNSIPAYRWDQLGKVRSTTDFDFNGLYMINWMIHCARDEIRVVNENNFECVKDNDSVEEFETYDSNPPVSVCFNEGVIGAGRSWMERVHGKVPVPAT